ncbi:MAG: VOC family protein [Anaeromassilibacillus sp.]
MLEHVAIWTRDLEADEGVYCAYFDGKAGAKYRSKSAAHPNFESYFLTFGDGSRLELMQMPTIPESAYAPGQEALKLMHIAFAVGGTDEVDAWRSAPMRRGGRCCWSHRTGDGYYEACILDPDGNRVEVTTLPEA